MSSNKKIIPLKLSDGTIIKVEVSRMGEQEVSADTKVFKQATNVIGSIADDISDTFQKINENVKPDTFSVTFGLDIGVESGQLTSWIVQGTSSANLSITMDWNK